jgi:hypothetical protein
MRAFSGLCLSLCLAALALPSWAAEKLDYRTIITPIIFHARMHGGQFALGHVVVKLVGKGPHETLTIAGPTISAIKPRQKQSGPPCKVTFRYPLVDKRPPEKRLSAKATCPKSALAISSKQGYEKAALATASLVLSALAELLEEEGREA